MKGGLGEISKLVNPKRENANAHFFFSNNRAAGDHSKQTLKQFARVK